MSYHYRDAIRQGSAYEIAKLLQKRVHAPDFEDTRDMLEAAMWMIDSLEEKIAELNKKLDHKQDRLVK